jgi:hypothetical protein
MPKYLAIHPVEPPAQKEAVVPIARKCKAGHNLDAYWVRSWLQMDDGKVSRVFCEWDAKDAESVINTLDQSIPELPPTQGVFEVSEIHGEDFR